MCLHLTEDLQHVAIDTTTSGDNEIIAAPGAGKYIAIDFIALNPDGGSNTLLFKSGSTTRAKFVCDDNQPLTFENTIQHPKGIITIASNAAFNLNLSAATSVTGFCRYRIVE